jgi:hypothetical protein
MYSFLFHKNLGRYNVCEEIIFQFFKALDFRILSSEYHVGFKYNLHFHIFVALNSV